MKPMPKITYNTDLFVGQREPMTCRLGDRYVGLSSEVNLYLRGYTFHPDENGKYWKVLLGKSAPLENYGCFVTSLYNGLVSALKDPGWIESLDNFLIALISGTYASKFTGKQILDDDGNINLDNAMQWILGSPDLFTSVTYSDYSAFAASGDAKYFDVKKRSVNLGYGTFAIVRTTSKNSVDGVLEDQGLHAMTLIHMDKDELYVYDPWRINWDPESIDYFQTNSGRKYIPFGIVKPLQKEYGVGSITVFRVKLNALKVKWSLPDGVSGETIINDLVANSFTSVERLLDQTFGRGVGDILEEVKDEAILIVQRILKAQLKIDSPYFGKTVRELAYRSIPALTVKLPPDLGRALERFFRYSDWLDKAIGAYQLVKPFFTSNIFSFVGGIVIGGAMKTARWMMKRAGKRFLFKRFRKAMIRREFRKGLKQGVRQFERDSVRVGSAIYINPNL